MSDRVEWWGESEPDIYNPRYLPILKSRQGELRALQELTEPIGKDLMPVIELVDADLDPADMADFRQQVEKLAGKVARAWPMERGRVAVDAFSIEIDLDFPVWGNMHGDEVPATPATPMLLQFLHETNVHAVPVVRLSDHVELTEHLRPFVTSFLGGACLRIGGEDLDDTEVPLEDAVQTALDRLDLPAEQVDLILDFGYLADDAAAGMSARLARFILPGLERMNWRSFAVAAGSFPLNLADVSAYAIAEIPRRDRALWMQLQRFNLNRALDYSDYGVTHPAVQVGVAFAAPPQIRYTTRDVWLVSKGRRNDRRGHKQFYDLCAKMRMERPEDIVDPHLSWGDQQFHLCADSSLGDELVGPGNASTWRAIATSHHLTRTLRSLRRRDEP